MVPVRSNRPFRPPQQPRRPSGPQVKSTIGYYAGKDPADPSVLRVVFASTGGEILELPMVVDGRGVVTAGEVSVVSHGRDPARLKRILRAYRSP